jgi:V8-like Glu-specific endopeptidase
MKKYLLLILILIIGHQFVNGQVSNDTVYRHVEKESFASLYLEIYDHDIKLGSATGFVIKPKNTYYLVTNYHVLSNKDPKTKAFIPGHSQRIPDRVRIRYTVLNPPGDSVIVWENLLDDKNKPLWHSDTINNEMIDVVELPLKNSKPILITPVDYITGANKDLCISPTEKVVIVGYPFGISDDIKHPIWQTGFIATEPDISQNGKPIVFVDVSAFPGMSGSPVYYVTNSIICRHKEPEMYTGCGVRIFVGVFSMVQFYGSPEFPMPFIYGVFWKTSALKNIFDRLP